MIISPMIAAEILGEIPPEKITAAVDPELDFESANGVFWVNLNYVSLESLTAREYLDIINNVSAWVDPDGINWMDTRLEVTEITYGDAMTAWKDTVKLYGEIIERAGVEAFWQSNGMTALGMPAIKLEMIE